MRTLAPLVREMLRLADLRAGLHACRRVRHGVRVRQPRQALRPSRASRISSTRCCALPARSAQAIRTRELFSDEHEYLATHYSLPTWLVRQWGRTFSASARRDLRRRQRAGAGGGDRQHVGAARRRRRRTQLAGSAVPRRGPRRSCPNRCLLESGRAPERDGPRMVAAVGELGDAGRRAQSAARRERSLDVCSGRGNKALQIGARLKDLGSLLCVERDERKAAALGRRLEAAGRRRGDRRRRRDGGAAALGKRSSIACCSTRRARGPASSDASPKRAGRSRAPTANALPSRSGPSSSSAARYVYPGGALVYAVCSTDPRETTEVMDWFLSRENFERGLIPAPYEGLLTPAGDVLVPPGIDGRDGFYIRARGAPRVNFLTRSSNRRARRSSSGPSHETFPSDLEPAQIARKLVSTMEAQTREDDGRLYRAGLVRRLRQPRRFRAAGGASRLSRARVGRSRRATSAARVGVGFAGEPRVTMASREGLPLGAIAIETGESARARARASLCGW